MKVEGLRMKREKLHVPDRQRRAGRVGSVSRPVLPPCSYYYSDYYDVLEYLSEKIVDETEKPSGVVYLSH